MTLERQPIYRSQVGGLPPRRDAGSEMVKRSDLEIVQKESAEFGQGVPAFWFARAIEIGGSSQNLYQPYADSVWVQAAVKQVSGPISSVAVEVSAAGASTKTGGRKRQLRWKSADTKPLDDAAIFEFLTEPSPGMSWEDFVQASIGFLKMSECFWVLDDSTNAPFPEARTALPKIKFARPDRMKPIVEDGVIEGWQYTPINGQPEFLPSNQVVRLCNWNPYDDYRGLGEYQAASIAAEADWLAGKFSRNLMANNGDLGGIIIAKTGVPTDAQREQIISQLREKRAAQLRGELKYTFMTGDVDVKDAKITSVDAPFISQRLENRHEIATAFGVPMSRFDIKASYSIGSASDYYQLIMDTCIPTGAKFCAGIERVIYLVTGKRVQVSLDWDEHPVLQEVRKERLAAADGLFAKGMPMRKISDYLNLDLPRFDGDTTGFIPSNILPITNEDGEVDRGPAPSDYSETPPTPDGEAPENEDAPDDGSLPESKALLQLLRGKAGETPRQKNNARNKAIWQSHMRARTASVKLYQSKASKVFNDYRVKALRHLAAAAEGSKSIVTKSLIDVIFNPDQFGASLVTALDPVSRLVLQTAGLELFAEIGRKDDPWKMPPGEATKFIQQRDGYIKGVGDTARSQLNTVIKNAVDEGKSISDMTDDIRGVFNNLSKNEARRVAMTETSAAYGFSRHQAMTDAGIEYKSWLSSHGPNVREAHADAEDEYADNPIPVDEPFIVDGEELMYPGDDSGSAGNIINCQCIQLAVAAPKSTEDQT